MEHKRLLRRFWGRLLAQALLFGALNGLILGAGSVFTASFIYHLLIRVPSLGLILGIFGGAFLVAFALTLALRYPTLKRIAARLDEAGLQERAGTMLEYAGKSSTLVRLQRKDAMSHIREVSPRQLGLRYDRRRLWIALIAVVLAAAMLLIPYDIFSPDSGLSPEELAKAQAVEELISQLRQQVSGSGLPEAIKEQLNKILDELEKALLETDSQLEQAILIEQARQDMTSLMNSSLSRYSIGTALQRFELTRTLGKHITSDIPAIPGTLDELQEMLEDSAMLVTKLSSNLTVALEDSGVEPSDFLYQAFADFAQGLASLSYSMNPELEEEDLYVQSDPNQPDALTVVFDRAEAAIMAALDEQALLEAEMDEVCAVLTGESQTLLGGTGQSGIAQPSGGTGGGTPEENNQGGSGTSDGVSGQMGGMASGPTNTGPSTMLEGIYDPISGSVTYGEVFAAYYAQYLQALEAGEIPQELQQLFDQYFSALS